MAKKIKLSAKAVKLIELFDDAAQQAAYIGEKVPRDKEQEVFDEYCEAKRKLELYLAALEKKAEAKG